VREVDFLGVVIGPEEIIRIINLFFFYFSSIILVSLIFILTSLSSSSSYFELSKKEQCNITTVNVTITMS